MNVVLLYDFIENNSVPFANGPFGVVSGMYLDCKDFEFVSFSHISTFDPYCDKLHLFPVDLQWQSVDTLFDDLTDRTVYKLKKHKIPIVFYLPSEGFSANNNEYKDFYKLLNQKVLDKDLSGCPLFFITGNLKINESRMTDIDFKKIFSVSYFENKLSTNLLDQYYEDITISQLKDPPCHDFLSYNGRPRMNRIALISELKRKKLLGNCLLSLHFDSINQIIVYKNDLRELLYTDAEKYFQNTFSQWRSITIDKSTSSYLENAYAINKQHFIDSHFSLVTETEYAADTVFLTEKIFKPIKALHPFIVWGSPGVLIQLRNRGYETFPELFDESYDEEINPKKRLAMIIDQVELFSSWPDRLKQRKRRSVVEKLLHNRNTFNENVQKFKKDYENIFSEIGKILNDGKS
jgi:hypothetical protein